MENIRTNIEKAFRKGIVILFLIIIAVLTIVLNKSGSSDISSLLVGLPLIIAGVVGILGSIQGIKGLKENT